MAATTEAGSEAYLDAFMNGFEFVLLAIRGRLAEADLPAAERARLEAFLADYWRISRAYHDRHPAAPARAASPALAVQGLLSAEIAPEMRN